MDAAPDQFDSPEAVMRRAIAIAHRGLGAVEPNPMVGAVLIDDDLRFIAEGWHEEIGGPHAEVNALRNAGERSQIAALFVTLEPCNHHGKTPPCTEAVLASGVRSVYIGTPDPAPHTNGAGIERLEQAGLTVHVGCCEAEALALTAPFRKSVQSGVPWVIAKWAMTLDGKIASHTGHSMWISSPESRAIVHSIRGRVDAVIVGRGTVLADDPSLTVRPRGLRVPLRVVLDRNARTAESAKLVLTAADYPTVLFATAAADPNRVTALRNAGVQVIVTDGSPAAVLKELGKLGCTNVLVEGGSEILGAFFDDQLIDEAHVFVAPKLVGGSDAATPIGGRGLESIPSVPNFINPQTQIVGGDTYISGRLHDR